MDRSQMSEEQFDEISSLLRGIQRAQEDLGAALTGFSLSGLDENDPDRAIRWLRDQVGRVGDRLLSTSRQLGSPESAPGPPTDDTWGPWEGPDIRT